MPAEGAMQEQAGVELDAVDKGYGAVQALRGVSLRVAPGEIVALFGPSGCGKSTLLELVCGLSAPDAGSVRAGAAALMPQRDALLPWLSALDNAALALRVAGVPRAQARARAHEHFEAFGALDALTRLQMQRWLAAALEREPRTVLLVTHDVEEAALLADRVVLLSPRPGRIVETLDVPLARPRERDDPALVELRERAL